MTSSVKDFGVLEVQADAIVKKYPQKRSAVLPLLHLVQGQDRHISGEAVKWIADKLGLQPINVWELVTFYPSFKEKQMGKVHLRVCKTLSCMMAGAEKTGEALCKELNCKMGETRADGEVSIEWVECLACCDKAPVVMVNNKLHTGITQEKAAALAREVKKA
jgi:NADH-quinone oxidoreductase subunit E